MKKYRFLAVFTALLITVCPLFGAAAQAASPVKEENVYARLNHNGSLESAYLVNVFYTSAEGTYTDYGPYTKVSSLSDPGNLSVNNGVVSFQAPAGMPIRVILAERTCLGRSTSPICSTAKRLTVNRWPASPVG